MKKLVLLLLISAFGFSLAAQTPSALVLQSEGGKLFLNHTVAPKENWYSIGRMYNVSPKELAPYNGTSIDKGLNIGEMLKVPVTATNFSQSGTAGGDDIFVPLYHVVSEKEGLYRIGQNYNKVKVEDLKAWNNLKSNEISSGQRLVVGYLKVKKSQSPLASNGVKKIGSAVAALPVDTNVTAPVVAKKEDKTTEPKVKAPEQQASKTADTTPDKNINTHNGGATAVEGAGYFKAVYLQQNKNTNNLKTESGQAAVFKSTSGWQDAKYYALMNGVSPGTIVRITNPANSRIIFAKVLGELPPGKENEGLLVRISNASAAELMINEKEQKFAAEVAFVKD